MSATYVEISSSEQALAVFTRLSEAADDRAEKVVLKPGWAILQVRIPNPPISSSISPPMMEAYLSIQREFYQLAALAKTGKTNINVLTDIDKHELEFLVKITEGSSNQSVDLGNTIDAVAKRLSNRLSGRQVTMIALGFGLLFSLSYCFLAYLESQKSMRLEDARSAERMQALQSMQFATEQQRKTFEFIIEQLGQHGVLGQRSRGSIESSYSALLRAAEQESITEINGERITAEQAVLLRRSSRNRPFVRFVTENMRVISINTAAEIDSIILMRPTTRELFTVKISETLFSGNDREKLFEALENRTEIKVDLAFREYGGEVRHTHFNRVVP